MLTIPEAAERVASLAPTSDALPLPEAWRVMSDGRPQLDWIKVVRRSRQAH